jgi:hypothetical protein
LVFGFGLVPGQLAANIGLSTNPAHFVAFLALSVSGGALLWPARALRLGGVLALAGFFVEVAQIWIPGRAFEWADVTANAAGAGTGGILAHCWFVWANRCRSRVEPEEDLAVEETACGGGANRVER